MRTTQSQHSFRMNLRVSLRAFLFVVWVGLAGHAQADVCVWRDPERVMQRLFPSATDYKTVTTKMTPAIIAAVEQQLGSPLDDSEKKEFDTYDINSSGKALGTALALAGKGEYGAIEVVIGIDNSGRIVGAYIQRSRERATAAIQSPDFLKQFTGKSKSGRFDLNSIKAASPESESASKTVAFVIRKMLILDDVLRK